MLFRSKIARRLGLLVGLPATLLLAFPVAATAAEYGEIARGPDYTACDSSHGNCQELFNTTMRGRYWCKALANHTGGQDGSDNLRFRCEVKDTNEDGHGVYVAIQHRNVDWDDGEHWEMASGVVGPQGTSEWWHSVGTWHQQPADRGKWRFHLCWYIPGEQDPCAGFTQINVPGSV